MMKKAGTKRIFISDLHMGDARSQAGRHPYGWFWKNIPLLAKFLNEQLDAYSATEVSEVVILGDLFDEWVIPTNKSPLASFQDIYNNHNNDPVQEPLRQLAAAGILTYVPGNHDMALSATNQAGNQKFMKKNFPGIHYLAEGVYRRGRLVAEHGHRYCLFNAAGKWPNKPSPLPLGYFLSRMVAYKVSTYGKPQDYFNILRKFIRQYLDSPTFVQDLYEAVVKDSRLEDSENIVMTGIPYFPAATVGAIGTLYAPLIDNWKRDRKDIIWELALSGDGPGDLLWAAIWIYFYPTGTDTNIVIFGHTHKWDLKQLPFLAAAPKAQVTLRLPFPAIYANSGAWIDTAPCCTYVETEEDAAAGRHYVRVLDFPDKNVLGQGYVNL